MQNLKEKEKGTIHAILAGLLLNGFIQGETREKLDDKPLDFAKKEFDKFLDKVRKETAECVCDKMIIEMEEEHDLKTGMKLAGIKKQIIKLFL